MQMETRRNLGGLVVSAGKWPGGNRSRGKPERRWWMARSRRRP